MKPKDRFFHKGPYKGSFTMHVFGSLRIVNNCHDQKEAFLGADDDASSSSYGIPFLDLVRPRMESMVSVLTSVKDSISEPADIAFDPSVSPFPPNSSSPSLSIPPELFQFLPKHATIPILT
ncbi:hypothetical protein K1719_006199 [Acacia pycnantha]|nr:hypothetical protein K1719_006199 [Acacia pycnantha]